MTPHELEAFGQKYYGAVWIDAMARDLGVSCSTVWRWHTGKTPINRDKLTLLHARLKRRKK